MKTSWRVVQRLCLIAGLLALGFTGYTYAARYAWQKYDSWRFDSIARQGSVAGSAEARRCQSVIDWQDHNYATGYLSHDQRRRR